MSYLSLSPSSPLLRLTEQRINMSPKKKNSTNNTGKTGKTRGRPRKQKAEEDDEEEEDTQKEEEEDVEEDDEDSDNKPLSRKKKQTPTATAATTTAATPTPTPTPTPQAPPRRRIPKKGAASASATPTPIPTPTPTATTGAVTVAATTLGTTATTPGTTVTTAVSSSSSSASAGATPTKTVVTTTTTKKQKPPPKSTNKLTGPVHVVSDDDDDDGVKSKNREKKPQTIKAATVVAMGVRPSPSSASSSSSSSSSSSTVIQDHLNDLMNPLELMIPVISRNIVSMMPVSLNDIDADRRWRQQYVQISKLLLDKIFLLNARRECIHGHPVCEFTGRPSSSAASATTVVTFDDILLTRHNAVFPTGDVIMINNKPLPLVSSWAYIGQMDALPTPFIPLASLYCAIETDNPLPLFDQMLPEFKRWMNKKKAAADPSKIFEVVVGLGPHSLVRACQLVRPDAHPTLEDTLHRTDPDLYLPLSQAPHYLLALEAATQELRRVEHKDPKWETMARSVRRLHDQLLTTVPGLLTHDFDALFCKRLRTERAEELPLLKDLFLNTVKRYGLGTKCGFQSTYGPFYVIRTVQHRVLLPLSLPLEEFTARVTKTGSEFETALRGVHSGWFERISFETQTYRALDLHYAKEQLPLIQTITADGFPIDMTLSQGSDSALPSTTANNNIPMTPTRKSGSGGDFSLLSGSPSPLPPHMSRPESPSPCFISPVGKRTASGSLLSPAPSSSSSASSSAIRQLQFQSSTSLPKAAPIPRSSPTPKDSRSILTPEPTAKTTSTPITTALLSAPTAPVVSTSSSLLLTGIGSDKETTAVDPPLPPPLRRATPLERAKGEVQKSDADHTVQTSVDVLALRATDRLLDWEGLRPAPGFVKESLSRDLQTGSANQLKRKLSQSSNSSSSTASISITTTATVTTTTTTNPLSAINGGQEGEERPAKQQKTTTATVTPPPSSSSSSSSSTTEDSSGSYFRSLALNTDDMI
jgi:hypothetical protein